MIVLDCSAAVEMARDTQRGEAFFALVLEGERIIASELFKAEVRNAFWKYMRAHVFTPEEARAHIAKACALVDEFVPLEENAAEAFDEAVRQNHSVYDLFYVTLARRHSATLMTADRKLQELCIDMRVNCVTEVVLSPTTAS